MANDYRRAGTQSKLKIEKPAVAILKFYLRGQNAHLAGMKILELNHVAIHVAELKRSQIFYRDVLRLEPLPRPAFDFPGAWFRLGETQELHLIGRAHPPRQNHNGNNHFALRVDDMGEWEQHLAQAGAEFRPKKQRPDGAWQIFIRDPDGHYIELFTPA